MESLPLRGGEVLLAIMQSASLCQGDADLCGCQQVLLSMGRLFYPFKGFNVLRFGATRQPTNYRRKRRFS